MRYTFAAMVDFTETRRLVVLVALACASSCGAFSSSTEAEATAGPSAVDAGVADATDDAPSMVRRDVTVVLDLPANSRLDPLELPRVSSMKVRVSDAADASRSAENERTTPGTAPFVIAGFTSSSRADVTVELRDVNGRLLGYGEGKGFDLDANEPLHVAVRKRLIYFSARDGGKRLRTFDLAIPEIEEGELYEIDVPLASLDEPSGLYLTADGRTLVQSGESAGAGAIAVFDTGTHDRTLLRALPFVPNVVAPARGGSLALAAPSGAGDTFALVDVKTAVITPVPSGVSGGAIAASDASTNADGTRVAIVGAYIPTGARRPYLFLVDFGGQATDTTTTAIDLSPFVDVATGVRFSADGKLLYVGGYARPSSVSNGVVLELDATAPRQAPRRALGLSPGKSQASALLFHPSGTHLYVKNDTQYAPNSSCCGGLRIVDLGPAFADVYAAPMTPSGPEFQLSSAVQLPYEPRRVLAGQTDEGNNVHQAFVDLSVPGAIPIAVKYVKLPAELGSVDHMVTPFGRSL